MASIANASSFLQSRAQAQQAPVDDPEHRLLAALGRQGPVPLPDLPKLLGMTAEQVLPFIRPLISRRRVEVIELESAPGVKFLRLA